jgi:signal transduction histidine kinase
LPLGEALGAWVIVSVPASLVALLIYGSSVLYDQALAEVEGLRTANERAQQLDALKDLFITHVNHELRMPIMTLQGVAASGYMSAKSW